MLLHFAALFLATASPETRLANACTAEGNDAKECACYAGFIKQHATQKELNALATLAEPQNRDSLEKALAALQAAGLTPGEIFNIGLKADQLKDAAEAKCSPKAAAKDEADKAKAVIKDVQTRTQGDAPAD